jgi:hypothetical protein
MNHAMIDPESLPASRLTGAEAMFLDVLEAVICSHAGAGAPAGAFADSARRGLDAESLLHLLLPFRAEFRQKYAALLERHLGAASAEAALVAFRSAALQRYVAARRAMVPELTVGLQSLVQRMGATEL